MILLFFYEPPAKFWRGRLVADVQNKRQEALDALLIVILEVVHFICLRCFCFPKESLLYASSNINYEMIADHKKFASGTSGRRQFQNDNLFEENISAQKNEKQVAAP